MIDAGVKLHQNQLYHKSLVMNPIIDLMGLYSRESNTKFIGTYWHARFSLAQLWAAHVFANHRPVTDV